jgi:large subunit ribosomal protein L30
MTAPTAKTLKLTYHKSAVNFPKDQRATVRSLGFHRLNQTIEKPDNPSIRGMVYKVRHLVSVEGEGELRGSRIHVSQDQD